MIKAIIADVDGVIVGKKNGVNFPLPNEQIIQELNQLHSGGTSVVLCTAKFNYAVRGIINKAKLSGPHITDGGALILDPISGTVMRKYVVEPRLARDIVAASILGNVYTEVYEAGD